MKATTKERIKEKLFIAFWVAVIVLAVAVVVAYIYALIAYGGKPVSEVPTWALWFIFGGKK